MRITHSQAMKKAGTFSMIVLCVFVAGCANQHEPIDRPPLADLKRSCPAGTTLVCFEKKREPISCSCNNRYTVDDVLQR